jgi:hypothetical protein
LWHVRGPAPACGAHGRETDAPGPDDDGADVPGAGGSEEGGAFAGSGAAGIGSGGAIHPPSTQVHPLPGDGSAHPVSFAGFVRGADEVDDEAGPTGAPELPSVHTPD